MRILMLLCASAACGGEKKLDRSSAGSARSATKPAAKAAKAAKAAPSVADPMLERRRAYAAQAEAAYRKSTAPASSTLRGANQDVLVLSGLIIGGDDVCDENTFASSRDPNSQGAIGWRAAGITRVECETRDGRTFGIDLNAAEPPKTAQAPAIDVTAKQLFADYQANEISADAKYKGRALRVSGTIARIGKDALDDPMLEIATSNEFTSVIASFESEAGLGSLRRRQPITVRCSGAGTTLGSPMLKGCSIEQTNEHIARVAVFNIATVAYEMWKADNPKSACPKTAAELLKYAEATHDPWAEPYRVACNSSAASEKRIRVQSDGPDKKPDTADDIKSWE